MQAVRRRIVRKRAAVEAPAENVGMATTGEACRYLRVSRDTVHKLRREGLLKARYAGRVWRWSWESLRAFSNCGGD